MKKFGTPRGEAPGSVSENGDPGPVVRLLEAVETVIELVVVVLVVVVELEWLER